MGIFVVDISCRFRNDANATSFTARSPQRRQSAMLFLQSSELGPPPHPQPSVSPPLVPGGTHSLAGEGVGGSQFGRGDRQCGTLDIYICTLRKSRTSSFVARSRQLLLLFIAWSLFTKFSIQIPPRICNPEYHLSVFEFRIIG
jgi:hypothetical protein